MGSIEHPRLPKYLMGGTDKELFHNPFPNQIPNHLFGLDSSGRRRL